MRYPRFNDTDIVSLRGSVLNQLFSDVEASSSLAFGTDFVVSQTTGGATVNLARRIIPDCTLNIVDYSVASGLYQCKQAIGEPLQVDPATSQDIPQTGESFPTSFDCYLENDPELGLSNSHWLPKGSNIEAVYRGQSKDAVPKPVYRVYVDGPPVIFQYVSVNAAAIYNGKVLSGTSSQATGSAFTAPAGMAATGSSNSLICSLFESGLTGNRVALSSWGFGVVVGSTSAGLLIVYAQGGTGATASPKTLPSGTYGLPDTTTYNRDSDGVGCVWTPFKIGYDGTSNTWWFHTRTATYDARGMLYSVTAEAETSQATTNC